MTLDTGIVSWILCYFLHSVKGFQFCGGSNFPFPHWLRLLLQTECCATVQLWVTTVVVLLLLLLLLRCRAISDDVGDHVIDASALCLLKPWWAAVLGSRYPSMTYTNYPNTSVSGTPGSPFLYPISHWVTTKFPDHAFSWRDPGKQVAVDGFVSSLFAVLPASIITSSLLFFTVNHILIILCKKTNY